eukprot:48383-Alexandrium_andersonii.AAC.1
MVLQCIAKRCNDIRTEQASEMGRHSRTLSALTAFCSFVELWVQVQENSCQDVRFMLRTVELSAAEGQVKDSIKDIIEGVVEQRT